LSRMLDATVSLIVGTFITVAYWFALAGPLNAITAAIQAAVGAPPAAAVPTLNLLNGISLNIMGVWLICTTVAYLIMFLWEGTRTEDVYSREGTSY
jgi:hypothetical protein